MTQAQFPTVARTIEPSASTLLLRRLLVLLVIASVVGALAAAGLATAGWLPAGDEPAAGPGGSAPAPSGTAAIDPLADGSPPAPPTAPALAPAPAAPGTVAPGTVAPGTVAPDAAAPVLPPRSSRLVAGPPRRVVDTREGDRAAPPAGSAQVVDLAAQPTAAVVSVSVLGAETAGAVIVDGLAGPVTAITVSGPGVTTSNLVVVPVVGNRLTISSSAGGHLVVDLVGTFQPVAGPVTAGRFVPVEPRQVGRLETAVDGRQIDIPLGGALPPGEVEAVLVELEADVGANGGVIRSGPGPDDLSQALMWGAGGSDGKQRHGLVLTTPDELNRLSLDYQGGSLLIATVVGYFTGDGAEAGTSGLFVPSGPRVLVDGPLEAGTPVAVDGLGADVAAVLVTTGSRGGQPGRLGADLVTVDGGSIVIEQPVSTEVFVTLLGSFLS